MKIFFNMFSTALLVALLAVNGCKKDDNPLTPPVTSVNVDSKTVGVWLNSVDEFGIQILADGKFWAFSINSANQIVFDTVGKSGYTASIETKDGSFTTTEKYKVGGKDSTEITKGTYTLSNSDNTLTFKFTSPTIETLVFSKTTFAQIEATVPNNIFPLVAGHRFDYTGYFTKADTETLLTNLGGSYNTTWTVGASVTPLAPYLGAAAPAGRTSASLISDSTLLAPPLAPITFKKFTPVFAYYDTASGDYWYLTNLGNFYRYNKVYKSASDLTPRADSLRFIKLASPKAGLGGTFTSFEETFTSYLIPTAPFTINLKITGTWEKKEDLILSGTTYNTYYLVIKRKATIGTTTASEGTTAKLWLVKGVGPVKMFLAGDNEVPGNYRELKSKNF